MNGKVFNVIFNMYNGIKSCVSLMGDFFSSFAGVRQGENLSPILFSMYLNDLEESLLQSQNSGIRLDIANDGVVYYIKLVVLCYAEDTVILAYNEEELQHSLDLFENYCYKWKLKVNMSKTKVVLFGARRTDLFKFAFEIEIQDRYKYLGIIFSLSRSFLNVRKHIAEQAKKLFLLLGRTNSLHLPVDLQLKLFDQTILSILMYGTEVS